MYSRAFSSIFPKYLGKYARKMRAGRYETGSEGKFASRWHAKSPDALCAVLPIGACFPFENRLPITSYYKKKEFFKDISAEQMQRFW